MSLDTGGQSGPALRIGVVGGGLIAQVAHLPCLQELRDRFTIVALAEPSHTVRSHLQRAYGIASTYADHRAMLAESELDALLVCAPNGSHAQVTLDGLEADLHVFVEKPLCITLADADRIVAARGSRVVQVGYMKRYDVGYQALLSELPESSDHLCHISTITYDPGLARFFGRSDIPAPTDVPEAAVRALKTLTGNQVEEAVGAADPETVHGFSDIFLGALVHDVNLVHGALERLNVPVPAPAACARRLSRRDGASGIVALPDEAVWTMAWMHADGMAEFHEHLRILLADAAHDLVFRAPYLRRTSARYECRRADDLVQRARTTAGYHDAYSAQLLHFYDCIVHGAPCMTPPEQAKLDIMVLTDLFRASTHNESELDTPLSAASA